MNLKGQTEKISSSRIPFIFQSRKGSDQWLPGNRVVGREEPKGSWEEIWDERSILYLDYDDSYIHDFNTSHNIQLYLSSEELTYIVCKIYLKIKNNSHAEKKKKTPKKTFQIYLLGNEWQTG